MITFTLWVAVGIVAGWIGRALVPRPRKASGAARVPVTVLAVLGALVAGMIGDFVSPTSRGDLGPDYISVLTATLGAAAVLVIARVIQIGNLE